MGPRQIHREDRGNHRKPDRYRSHPQELDRPCEANEKPKTGQINSPRGTALCFNCNQPGHFASKCPHLQKRKQDQLQAAHTEQLQESDEEGDREDASDTSDSCQEKGPGDSGLNDEFEDLIKFEINKGGYPSDDDQPHAMTDNI
jgi:hypothetical protein